MADDNGDSAERWRSKYLSSLDKRDSLEKAMQEQIDELRKTLLVVMLVCRGIDSELDESIKALADQLRGATRDIHVGPLVDKVQKRAGIVLDRKDFDQLREQLSQLLSQLRNCDIDRALQKRLVQEEKALQKQLKGYQDLPPLLEKMAEHQRDVLMQMGNGAIVQPAEKPFWRRLFSGDNEQEAQIYPETREDSDTQQQIATEQELLADEDSTLDLAEPGGRRAALEESVSDGAEDQNAEDGALEHDEPETTDQQEQDVLGQDFTLLSRHIGSTLMDLLSQLAIPDRLENDSYSLQRNIDGGITWYELVPNLERMNRIVLGTVGQTRNEFENYLKVIHDRLADFQARAGLVRQGMQQARGSNEKLDASLREGIDHLQRSMEAATDLEALKEDVGQRLDTILQTIEVHKQELEHNEQADKLQQLTSRMQEMEQETQQLKVNLSKERARATRDRLTGLPNRLAYETRVESEYARWKRYQEPLVLAVADIDLFKNVNDRFGHLAGDKLLRIFARQLQKNLREVDFIARYGGEEFIILMPNTALQEGQQVAEKVRAAIEVTPLHYKSDALTITASFGVTEFRGGDTVAEVFERADTALYKAKEQGRNRVSVEA
ncbi:GGDEF domain-containing protein [Aestuariirhabdus sp. Z084]|uniref:GGDEF domain-containing protein n=1 Tax=Aestuariirhabdus haliotis TaxID=2918751 RepID=UPI00201B38A4|nr:GGDEF domain-containing protein [Aestuariirhabdus haliotis]MCL6414290.1 GGDEF domain-containing protein [Aestuariirhabdus haliotis]MCL6418222.1 GGDEF domain-containing protein [Aestuariirhabdus haliotis]